MTHRDEEHPAVTVLDEEVTVTLAEVSRCCALPAEEVLEMVEEGLIEPIESGGRYYFTAHALWRARTASRLQRDLDVNLAGAAVALDLLEEIRRLRRLARGGEPFDEL